MSEPLITNHELALAGDLLDDASAQPVVQMSGALTLDGASTAIAAPRSSRWARKAKRAIDVLLSSLALILGSPIFAAIALAILIFEGRPILFHWNVIGEGGRPFRGYKFRTMVVGADALRAELASHNEMQGPVFKMRNDPRVTSIGTWLRRYSLDELPQFWSVLKGDMSLVGPRPLGPKEYAEATPYQRQKLGVVPGITCLWQVQGRSQIADFDEWVELDLQYIEEWSIWLDLKILLRTVPAVVRRQGAW
jgi:lipopolysaccharide/colanic/teichoic acid biosynthesis glycosyltransferase